MHCKTEQKSAPPHRDRKKGTKTLAFTFLKKKKKSHFAFKEGALIHQKNTKRHKSMSSSATAYNSWGEDESAEKADGRERFVGRDRE